MIERVRPNINESDEAQLGQVNIEVAAIEPLLAVPTEQLTLASTVAKLKVLAAKYPISDSAPYYYPATLVSRYAQHLSELLSAPASVDPAGLRSTITKDRANFTEFAEDNTPRMKSVIKEIIVLQEEVLQVLDQRID